MFNTIHIFGSGDTQFINQNKNRIVSGASIVSQTALVNHIKSFIPEGVVLTDYHVIHIFKDMDARYLGKGTSNRAEKTSFSVKVADLDQAILNAFTAELEAAVNALPEPEK